ncbi:hypothetical protein WKW50_16230 [Ochrobactrum sp. GPK 3]
MSSEFQAAIDKHGISIKAEFVPFSRSRNAANDPGNKPGSRSLNWKVTLVKDGRDIITTDYSAGCGHCPSYKQNARWTLGYTNLIVFETEHGFAAKNAPWGIAKGKPLLPDTLGVIHSLITDSDVLDCSGFEHWAADFGYDTDSRKAESIYRACIEIALQVRNGLGDKAFREVQEASRDY